MWLQDWQHVIVTLYITIPVLKLFSSILFFIKSIPFIIVLDHYPYCAIIDSNLVCEKGSDILTCTITTPNKVRTRSKLQTLANCQTTNTTNGKIPSTILVQQTSKALPKLQRIQQWRIQEERTKGRRANTGRKFQIFQTIKQLRYRLWSRRKIQNIWRLTYRSYVYS